MEIGELGWSWEAVQPHACRREARLQRAECQALRGELAQRDVQLAAADARCSAAGAAGCNVDTFGLLSDQQRLSVSAAVSHISRNPLSCIFVMFCMQWHARKR